MKMFCDLYLYGVQLPPSFFQQKCNIDFPALAGDPAQEPCVNDLGPGVMILPVSSIAGRK